MEHLSFEIICRIADGDMPSKEKTRYSTHWHSCPHCRLEVEMQRSLIKVTRQSRLTYPSSDFTKRILEVISPEKKKKWYEELLQNMGNVFAMVSVIAFLGYIYSVTSTGHYQLEKSVNTGLISEILKVINDGSHQLWTYLKPTISFSATSLPKTHITIFVLFALTILVFVDRIVAHFFKRSKV